MSILLGGVVNVGLAPMRRLSRASSLPLEVKPMGGLAVVVGAAVVVVESSSSIASSISLRSSGFTTMSAVIPGVTNSFLHQTHVFIILAMSIKNKVSKDYLLD